MMKKLIITLLLFLSAQATQAMELPDLKEMMKGLGKSAQNAQKAMLNEDEELLYKSAKEIADHREVKSNTKFKIATVLKLEMGDFKEWDEKVHKAASDLAKFANAGDKQAQNKAYVKMIQGCFGCHLDFRYRLKGAN
ncbi:MAG: hypothetical protein QNL04_05665 [SAR324 cluster bacterium]|nr:hypothetical protein [SAR324 cluster bacterium]